jgi:hypothetical protein
MKQNITYICDNCGVEFKIITDCERHEHFCCNKTKLYRENIENAINKLKSTFSSLIETITYETKIESSQCEDDNIIIYKFEIVIKLTNGNTVLVHDGMDEYLHLGNFLTWDVIYNSAEREIKKCIPTSFEGIMDWNYGKDDIGWRTEYIGDILISEIVDVLRGRKVKIEAID